MNPKRRTKTVLLVIAIIVVGLALVWMRAFGGARTSYGQGEKFFEDKAFIRAVTYYDRCIHWYTPFNPYVEKACRRLWEIGHLAEKEGDTQLALIAYRTIRTGFYAARSIYTPGKHWIRKSESKIDQLLGNHDNDKEKFSSAIESQKVVGPHPGWSVLVVLGFLGWVGSLVVLIWFSWAPLGKAKGFRSISILWICLACTFFVLWIVGMFQA